MSERRPIAKNELLFRGTAHKAPMRRAHLWTEMRGPWGVVVACGVCGKLRKGETLPADWPVLT